MASIMRITPEQLRALNLRLIVVGCGNWKMISGYRSEYEPPIRKRAKQMLMTLSCPG